MKIKQDFLDIWLYEKQFEQKDTIENMKNEDKLIIKQKTSQRWERSR